MSSVGWEKLRCTYFYRVCVDVCAANFLADGFWVEENSVGGVIFRKDDVFIEISYDVGSSPNYALKMVIGIGSRAYDENGKFTGVPIWYVIPENVPEYQFFSRTFSNEKELKSLLVESEDLIFRKHVKPLLENRLALQRVQERFAAR